MVLDEVQAHALNALGRQFPSVDWVPSLIHIVPSQGQNLADAGGGALQVLERLAAWSRLSGRGHRRGQSMIATEILLEAYSSHCFTSRYRVDACMTPTLALRGQFTFYI